MSVTSTTVPSAGVCIDNLIGPGHGARGSARRAKSSVVSTLVQAPGVLPARTVAATHVREVSIHFSHTLSSKGAAGLFARRRIFSTWGCIAEAVTIWSIYSPPPPPPRRRKRVAPSASASSR